MARYNKGGRPETENKREVKKLILFTKEEFEFLKIKYSESKTYHNLNDMIRDILIKQEYKVLTTDQKLLVETSFLIGFVRKVGVNFNQLIRHFNQKKLDSFSTFERDAVIFNLQEIKKSYDLILTFFNKEQK